MDYQGGCGNLKTLTSVPLIINIYFELQKIPQQMEGFGADNLIKPCNMIFSEYGFPVK